MDYIFDHDNKDYSRVPIILGKESWRTITIRIKCKAHYFLSIAAQPAGATITGRLLDTGNYVDLAANPIDLSPFDGEMKSFEIKIESGNPSANFTKLPVELRVSFNGN